MYSILKKMSKAVQVVLAAPVKLPPKVVTVAKYVAIALGILEAIVPDRATGSQEENSKDEISSPPICQQIQPIARTTDKVL